MRQFRFILLLTAAVVIVTNAGCKRQGSEAVEVAKALEQSFQAANPETKQAVAASVAAMNAAAGQAELSAKSAHYIEAMAPMKNLVAGGSLSREQVQAAKTVFQQVNKAVQKDPRLATKQMYDAQNALAQALYAAGVRP